MFVQLQFFHGCDHGSTIIWLVFVFILEKIFGLALNRLSFSLLSWVVKRQTSLLHLMVKLHVYFYQVVKLEIRLVPA